MYCGLQISLRDWQSSPGGHIGSGMHSDSVEADLMDSMVIGFLFYFSMRFFLAFLLAFTFTQFFFYFLSVNVLFGFNWNFEVDSDHNIVMQFMKVEKETEDETKQCVTREQIHTFNCTVLYSDCIFFPQVPGEVSFSGSSF